MNDKTRTPFLYILWRDPVQTPFFSYFMSVNFLMIFKHFAFRFSLTSAITWVCNREIIWTHFTFFFFFLSDQHPISLITVERFCAVTPFFLLFSISYVISLWYLNSLLSPFYSIYLVLESVTEKGFQPILLFFPFFLPGQHPISLYILKRSCAATPLLRYFLSVTYFF